MDKFLLSNTGGEKSVTVTAFVLGFIIASLKLLFSGMVIYGFTVPVFGGGEFAMVVGALGAVYSMRRSTETKTTKE